MSRNAMILGRMDGEPAQFEPIEQIGNRLREIASLSQRAINEMDRGGWNRVITLVRAINKLATEGVEQATVISRGGSRTAPTGSHTGETPALRTTGNHTDLTAAEIEAAQDAFEMMGVDFDELIREEFGDQPQAPIDEEMAVGALREAPLPREFAEAAS